MKKILFLITVVFAALAILSCSKEGSPLSIKSKNLVGTWALTHGTFEVYNHETEKWDYVEMDITEPPFNRRDRIYDDDVYDSEYVYDISYYEEIVFTEYTVKFYEWDGDQSRYDEDKDDYYLVWDSDLGELEYHIRDNAIWIFGMKAFTIQKLTTKELILCDGENETLIRVYHKKK